MLCFCKAGYPYLCAGGSGKDVSAVWASSIGDDVAQALQHKYNGQALTLLGDKGRFVLPPEFRNIVKLSSEGRTLCLLKDEEFDCLVGFGLSREDDFEAMLDREEDRAIRLDRDFSRLKRSNQLYGYKKIPFDDSGRFTMPDYLISLGKITDALYFQGAGSSFTIWSPEVLACQDDGWASAKAACADMMAEVAAKAKKRAGGKGK